jgi:acetyltransferase
MHLKEFFEAKKIAVVGAAREREKVGNVIFRNLIENKILKVFPINPNTDYIEGVKTLPSVMAVPFPLDLVIIAVPSQIVPAILQDCGEKGVKNIIIISAGFSEAGNVELTDTINDLIEKYNLNVLGPNVMGIINNYRDMNASFFSGKMKKGGISFVSQSGALGSAVLDKIIESNLGFANFISMGNMMQIDFISALEYLIQDRNTEVIMLYIESLKDGTGRKFIDLCKKSSKKIIVLKAGKSENGLKAAMTHTASLSSDAKIYSGAFKQAEIIEAESLEEMFVMANIFSKYKNFGKRGCVITNAGGLGVLAVDSLSDVSLPDIPEKILKEFDSIIPKGYSRKNPLDILGEASAERYLKVMKMLDKESWFDFFVVLASPQAMTNGKEIAKVLNQFKKPIFACFVGGKSFAEARKIMTDENIIHFEDVSELKILSRL